MQQGMMSAGIIDSSRSGQDSPGSEPADKSNGACQDESNDNFDQLGFNKRQLKTSAYETYAMCGALLCGFCCCTICIDHKVIDAELRNDPLRYWALVAHQVLVRMCTAFALYSTLVFMLSSMYAKTALSQPHFSIKLYDEYAENTAHIRHSAFYVMIFAFMLYMVSIGLLLFYTLHDKEALLGCLVVLAVFVGMLKHVQTMLDNAGAIFMPVAQLREQHKPKDTPNDKPSKDADETLPVLKEVSHHRSKHRQSLAPLTDGWGV